MSKVPLNVSIALEQ